MDLSDITLAWALERLANVTFQWHKDNLSYYDGDHWQNGQGWTGPAPSENAEGFQTVIDEIRRAFVSKNAIKEVVQRHTNAIIGHEPAWNLTPVRPLADEEEPTTEEQDLIAEAEALVTEWWDERGCHRILQAVVDNAGLSSRCGLRLFVPPGLRDEQGRIPPGTLQESIKRVFLSRPSVDRFTVYVDEESMQQFGIYTWSSRDGSKSAEVCYVDPVTGETVIRIVEKNQLEGVDLAANVVEYRHNLGGRMTVFEVHRDAIITEQVRSLQKFLNMTLTMAQRNTVIGGFLERTILNAQMPGYWEEDANAPEGRVFIPDPPRLGAGSVAWIMGAEITQSDGSKTYASPQMQYRDPIATVTFKDSGYMAYRSILEEVHQVHALLAGEAAPSGESRRQAVADFVADIRKTKSIVDEAGRWLIETILAMAALFAGQPGRYDTLRANFDARLDPGPTTTEAQQLVINQRGAGILSLETAMVRSDVDDPDAELAKIQAEKAADLAQQFFAMRGGEAPDLDTRFVSNPDGSVTIPPAAATGPVGASS